jgi:hypothetical protein
MSPIQTVLIIAGVIYYIYSSVKGNDAQKNRKTPSNPTPSKKSTLDEILDKMLEQQKKKVEELNKPEPTILETGNKKLVFKEKNKTQKSETKKRTLFEKKKPSEPQGLPFEKRKFTEPREMPFEKRRLTEPREMPSRKQIERVVIREKKATEPVVIKVKDYDLEITNHETPHKEHPLPNQSDIQFHFKTEEQEQYIFDARQAIISQIILERKF